MKWPMSISLNVVSKALVFYDSLRRLAMVWRILLILTRYSVLEPAISEGAFLAWTTLPADEGADGACCGAA